MKNVLHILRIVGTLFLIAALVAASLAGINAITQPRIAEYKAEKMEKAMKEVLPEGENLNAVAFTDETGMVNAVYACDAGFVVEVAPAGFGGTISMMVGIDMEGAVKGVSIVSQTETAGLGAVAAATTAIGIRALATFPATAYFAALVPMDETPALVATFDAWLTAFAGALPAIDCKIPFTALTVPTVRFFKPPKAVTREISEELTFKPA